MPNIGLARWASYQDADTQINSKIQNIYIKQDGSFIEIDEIKVKILKEQGIANWAQYIYPYNPAVNTVKILKATTTLNNKTYTVASHKIQDSPIPSESGYFTSRRHINIPYQKISVNSIIFLKTKKIQKKSNLFPYYYNYFSLREDYIKSSNINIISEIPLYINIHDPEKIFTIQTKIKNIKNKKLYIINIEQKNPFYKHIIDEELIYINPKYWPRVSVSSRRDNISDAKIDASLYQSIAQQPLPVLYKKIAQIAQTKKTAIDKINTVTSLLAEEITYLSDGRTAKSGIMPQSLKTIADTRLGDCKDFTIGTLVILKSLGIPSKIVNVYRGEGIPVPTDSLLQSPWYFNHIMLKVELPTGPIWVDPTNFASMAPYIFPDISDRHAIILDGKNSHYETIPPIKPHEQRFIRRSIWDVKNEVSHIKGSVELCGIAAQQFTGFAKKYSTDAIKNIFIQSLGNKMPILNYQVSLPDLTSRIVNDLLFEYSLTTPFSSLKTNTGKAIALKFNFVNKLIAKPEAVSDLYLGTPKIIDDYLTINNLKPIGSLSLNCKIESPWANIVRTVRYENNKILIHQQLEIKKSWIEAADFQSDPYQKLKLVLEQNFINGVAVVF